ncbi:MAG: ATP-binding protein [Proteobacteria bacterium]|nr:ATP-binding protein [Pseudomonadota bacterium]MBU1741435.1 ATP-binding protein [Pseudomonadota bacterium]
MVALPDFEMPFEPTTIEHLGLRLYSTLPPVISELVSNAYDAESPKVEIVLPTDEITADAEVIIRDYGHAMTPQEVQEEYLPIGRNRRGSDASEVSSKNGKVRVTGRKGLGKLSAFGVATEMDVTSIKDGFAVCLRLNYADMKSWPDDHPGQPYKPTVVQSKTGATEEKDGLEVRLRKLHRSKRISPELVRRGLAKRLKFIGPDFEVLVNGDGIQPGDRLKREQCDEGFSWDASELPDNGQVDDGLTVRGWIGFLGKASQVDRGVDIFASDKAVELWSYFNYPSTHAQFARAHLVGEIHADFLDGNEDLIATARNSVVWESDIGRALRNGVFPGPFFPRV